ncbi:MAG: hypothetical protein K2M95_03035 [Clostridiales bacterium]|nr:hypothetical protein [Clostridiales bacterium]
MNEETDLNELSPRKMMACNITAALIVIAAGVFLLLCGVHVVPVRASRAVVGTLLCAIGLSLLCSALIQRNSVSLWLSVCFLVPALIELLVKATHLGYVELYPLYIAIPALASLCTMLLTHEWKTHGVIAALFGVPAILFALKSSGLVGWGVTVPLLVVYAGAVMLVVAVVKALHKKEEQ